VKLEGAATLPASREKVWELLNDPARLAKILPGCERLEPDGPDRFRVAVKFGIAAISGNYSGWIQLSEKKPPESLRMEMEGKGAPGFVKGGGRLELREKNGATEIFYAGEAQVGGVIAAVGQRLIEATARKIVQQFFEAAEEELKRKG
jgi:uncharacterized protein